MAKMKQKGWYVKKYGAEAGTTIFRLLKTNAANAKWKEKYKAERKKR